MKKNFKLSIIISIIVSFLMFLSLSEISFAKSSFGGGGGGRSSFSGGGGSRSSSFSFSGGRSKSSVGSPSGSSKSYFSGGSVSSPSPTPKSSFDANASKAKSREASAEKFNAYKDKTAPKPPTEYSKTYGAGTNNPNVDYSRAYQYSRPTGYYVPSNTTIIYRDNFSNNFMMYATTLWMFHHWDSIDKSRFDDQKRAELEARVRELERQGVKRDPNYVQPVPDPPENKKESSNTSWVIGFIIVFVILLIIGYILYQRYIWKPYR